MKIIFNIFLQVIELELNKYYVKEADKKIEMINAFLPEHFTKRGGELHLI